MNGNIPAQVDEEMLETMGCHEIDQPVRDPALRRAAHVDRGLVASKKRTYTLMNGLKLLLLPLSVEKHSTTIQSVLTSTRYPSLASGAS